MGGKSLLTTHGSTVLLENQKWMIAATITQNLCTFPFFRFPYEQSVSVSRILRRFNNNLSKNCQSKSGIASEQNVAVSKNDVIIIMTYYWRNYGRSHAHIWNKMIFYKDKTALAIGRKYGEILWMETLFQCPVIKLVSNKKV